MATGIYPRKKPSPYMKKKLAEEALATKKAAAENKKASKRAPKKVLHRPKLRDYARDVELQQQHGDKVNPQHYVGKDGSEVIDAIENFDLQKNMYRGQAIQYMFRAGRKDTENTVADLLKAIWYINREIRDIQRQAKDAAIGRDRSHDVRMAS